MFLILTHFVHNSRILWGLENCGHPHISLYLQSRAPKFCTHLVDVIPNIYKPFTAIKSAQLTTQSPFSHIFGFTHWPLNRHPKSPITTDLNELSIQNFPDWLTRLKQSIPDQFRTSSAIFKIFDYDVIVTSLGVGQAWKHQQWYRMTTGHLVVAFRVHLQN